jgi:O-methyltransferase
MKRYLRKCINLFGFDVIRSNSANESNLNINENLGYELEDQAVESISLIKNNTMLSKRRLVTLYQQVEYCEKNSISGAFVECGVWKGGAMGLMALANLRFGNEPRSLHLFDAFDDICEPDSSVDGERAVHEVKEFTKGVGRNDGRLQPLKGFYDSLGGAGTLDDSRELLENKINYPEEMINYHVGWFQDTLPNDIERIEQIAILRLDGDWYASTKVCLEYLFDKVVKGGVVIIDDYGAYEGCRKAVDEYLISKHIKVYLASVDNECRFFIKS